MNEMIDWMKFNQSIKKKLGNKINKVPIPTNLLK